MKMLPHVASRVLGTPLTIGQAKLEAILSALGPRILGSSPRTIEGQPFAVPGEPRRRRAYAVTPEGVAVVPVVGTLVRRAGPIEAASGLTSYAELETEILDATTDPAVRAILLDVDSPGGEAAGVFDLADLVFEARSLKPVWAVANEEAFSGAYAIASAAERVVVPRTGGVGSVGVVAVHVDRSARDAMEGHRYTTVFAGARKNDFNPHEPLADAARSRLQAEVDRVYGIFVDTVARNRGLAIDAVRATEAGLFFGDQAVSAGLADEVGTMREALAALGATVSAAGPASRATRTTSTASTRKEKTMTEHTNVPGSDGGGAPPPASANTAPVDPATETAKPEPVQAPTGGAEVIDLDKVRAEARGEGYREAALIADLCALAGMPGKAAEMIGRGVSVDEARKELLALRAGDAGTEVRSHVLPGAGTGQPVTLDDNPVVRAAKARAAAAKEV